MQVQNGMSSIKIIIASEATHIYRYKNMELKILKCCASIYFNKQCLKHNLTPITQIFLYFHMYFNCTSSYNTNQLKRSICKWLNEGQWMTETSSPKNNIIIEYI